MSTPLLSETLNCILDLAPSQLNFSRTPLTRLFLMTSMPINPPGTHPHLPQQCWQFSIKLDFILPARHPQRTRHSHAAPPLLWLSLFSRCFTEWCTLPGLGSDHLPIDINLQLAPIRHTNTRAPAFNFKKAHCVKLKKFITEHLPPPIKEMQNIHCAARSFSLLLLNAAKASILFGRLGRPPKAWWSKEAELAVRDRWKACSEIHRLAYVEASRRVSSVISRAKAETWQATYNNLPPRSNPRAVFNLLNTVAGKKGSSSDPEFPYSESSKGTANIYASYLRSHFSLTNSPALSWCWA